jgi:hypothetical protein
MKKQEEKMSKEKQGVKHDDNKVPLDLLSPYAIEGLGKVLLMGKNKYGARNWELGFPYTRIIGAILRHTFALLRGERLDPESGLFHGHHIAAEAMFLCHFFETKTGTDDLPKDRTSSKVERDVYVISKEISDKVGYCPQTPNNPEGF